MGRLMVENLGGEVIHDLAIISPESTNLAILVLVPMQRQPGEVNASRPAFGPILQHTDVLRLKAKIERLVEQSCRLCLGKTKLVGTYFRHLTPRTQSGQRQ